MHITRVALGLSLAACCLSASNLERDLGYDCMSYEDARQVAVNFENMYTQFQPRIADASMVANFTWYSDSLAMLINSGCNNPSQLGKPIFSSREEFEVGQSSQPPVKFQIVQLWHDCKAATFRWQILTGTGYDGATDLPIRGLSVAETVRAPAGAPFPWLMSNLFHEFNSAAWLENLGVFVPNCDTNGSSITSNRGR